MPSVNLEPVNTANRHFVLEINRTDIPLDFVEAAEETLTQAEYGDIHALRGHCYAIKYGDTYAGMFLIGEGLPWDCDPEVLRNTFFYRILGFIMDKNYRGMGIGSAAMEQAIHKIYAEYGPAPIVIECHKDNKRAIHFYEKHGFRNMNVMENEDIYFIRPC